MKKFVLIYIFLRPFIAAFYDTSIYGLIRVTDIAGLFPIILLIYYARNKKPYSPINKYITNIFIWLCFSTIISYGYYNTDYYEIVKFSFRFLNLYSTILAFPLIFKTEKDVKDLIITFICSTFFPLIQGLLQIFVGGTFLGLKAEENERGFIMYGGLYDDYGIYVTFSIIGLLCLIYWSGHKNFLRKTQEKITYISLFILYVTLGIITLSRTMFIQMIVLVISFFSGLKLKKNFLIAIIFIGIFVLFVLSDFFQSNLNYLSIRSGGEFEVVQGDAEIESGLHGRVARWEDKTSQFFEDFNFFQQAVGTSVQVGPHSDYLYWMFKYGYIGLILYLIFLIRITHLTFKYFYHVKDTQLKQYGKMCLTGIAVWLLGSFIYTVSITMDLAYIIMGSTAIFINLCQSKNLRENKIQFIRNNGFSLK